MDLEVWSYKRDKDQFDINFVKDMNLIWMLKLQTSEWPIWYNSLKEIRSQHKEVYIRNILRWYSKFICYNICAIGIKLWKCAYFTYCILDQDDNACTYFICFGFVVFVNFQIHEFIIVFLCRCPPLNWKHTTNQTTNKSI